MATKLSKFNHLDMAFSVLMSARMKTAKKLRFHAERVRVLSQEQLQHIGGGTDITNCPKQITDTSKPTATCIVIR